MINAIINAIEEKGGTSSIELVMMYDFLRMIPGSDLVGFLTESKVPYQAFFALLSNAHTSTLLQRLLDTIRIVI
jgi:hypothetical protein